MSADNCIAILKTTDNHKVLREGVIENTWGKGITAYRVAHIQAAASFEYYLSTEIHNLGYWMYCNFPYYKVYYSEIEACKAAEELCNSIGYVEYGVVELDASGYNFPGC